MSVRHPEIRVRLAGPTNDFCILDDVTNPDYARGMRF
jgi:hypothetical protein